MNDKWCLLVVDEKCTSDPCPRVCLHLCGELPLSCLLCSEMEQIFFAWWLLGYLESNTYHGAELISTTVRTKGKNKIKFPDSSDMLRGLWVIHQKMFMTRSGGVSGVWMRDGMGITRELVALEPCFRRWRGRRGGKPKNTRKRKICR